VTVGLRTKAIYYYIHTYIMNTTKLNIYEMAILKEEVFTIPAGQKVNGIDGLKMLAQYEQYSRDYNFLRNHMAVNVVLDRVIRKMED